MDQINKLQVEAIEQGTIIDHIPIKIGVKLLSLFNLNIINQRITICLNLPSSLIGCKDLIKMENTFLDQEQINQLAIYAPNSTIKQIKKYKVVSKITPSLPDFIKDVIICPNNNCISRSELIFSSFIIEKNKNNQQLKCIYCEREFTNHIMLIK
ncbi:aspartate carbamoyltransferase regulatory subunit [Pantoea sp. SoEX]|uniref:aspartate carbamoyltransferase regulatory subunit n=1 Tax=Pantoea sp. SoEX TaxID=2576763 RepID=UPI0013567507|nr:aspartate carbamoyltransferase regulatory subunit [Pantoea sp. SoEX]MXP51108.1 aspartate carbamoyltransferase regulatory subunit [Pantoea sp. SoEX]